jgi:hypothetical protein
VAEYSVHACGISHDLGRSLQARINLFSAESGRASTPATRAILRRMLFNQAMHLALAVVRGRAREVPQPRRLAWRTASDAAGPLAPVWALAFAAHLPVLTGIFQGPASNAREDYGRDLKVHGDLAPPHRRRIVGAVRFGRDRNGHPA